MNIYIRTQDNDLCKYLSDDQSQKLMNAAALHHCQAAEQLGDADTLSSGFLVLLSGELELKDTDQRTLASIFPGEFTGELAFLGYPTQSLFLSAVKPSSFYLLSFDKLHEFMGSDPELAARMMAAIGDSLCLKTIHLTHHRNHG